jgi:glutamyl-Q tRNA(Asp) synthetase
VTFRTRFAPSPTGPLHLGHAFSALVAHDLARAAGGTFLLRIDDLDTTRARPEWEAHQKDDLAWLGLTWPEPCRRESEHAADYAAALDTLWSAGLLYPCVCSRRDIRAALSAPQEGALPEGPDGLVYPGTCRPHTPPATGVPRPVGVTLRLDMARACDRLGADARVVRFREDGAGPSGETGCITVTREALVIGTGDVVLARRDFGAAYHLAVVVDDAAQAVTHVVRGEDLFAATRIHVLLQRLLGLSSPAYHHHRLIRDAAGRRLAKRDDARAIATFRAEGATPADIRDLVDL